VKTVAARLFVDEIVDPGSPWFRRVVDLMAEVFPPEERMNVADFEETLEERKLGVLSPFNVHLLIARRDDTLLGFCQGSYLALPNVAFVSYLAVRPKIKGRKLGAVLRQSFLHECRRDARVNGKQGLWAVVGEVEEDNPWLRTLVRSRGAIALDIDYHQPSLAPNLPHVPLVLYVQRRDRSRSSLRVSDVRRLVYWIYRRVYRVQFPLRNSAFQAFLTSLAGRHRIGQRKLPPARSARLEKGALG
jgi:GNAT superfamily N-acetyltransferase